MLKQFKKIFKNVRIRKLLASAVIAWSLLWGSKLASPESLNQKDQVTHERHELNSLEDSRNSGEIIQTGTGTILSFQQKIKTTHDSGLNEFLLEINTLNIDSQEIILVKDTGNSGSFFAEGF